MADVRDTKPEVRPGQVDFAKLDSLVEEDITRFNVEDGFDPYDTLKGLRRAYTPGEVRRKAGLTQADMAARLTVPLKTWRNWEQGRVSLDPAVTALLALVADDPERAFQVLDGGPRQPIPAVPQDISAEEAERKDMSSDRHVVVGHPERRKLPA